MIKSETTKSKTKMCGIVGIFNIGHAEQPDKALLKRMADAISYRGPDQEGYHTDSGVGLGHKRLSIIDLSEKAKQPMCNENSDVWIVFNGEIYNFAELREELEKKGHRFRSDSDTETIIHSYEEYGTRCLKKLDGMFAFAIYDARDVKKRLFIARDRLGKKPLYYHSDKKRFVFASELKAVIKDRTIKREIDSEAIQDYLTYGYIPAPKSIFKGIKKILPGHYMIAYSDGSLFEKQYWDLEFRRHDVKDESFYTTRILEELERATKKRMISDVPLGAFLSGGIDSSSVVAMMARNSDKPIKTFSIGFDDSSMNELSYARTVAEMFSTDHKELMVTPNMADMLPKLIWYYNEPYADSSALPSYYVANMTRKHVTVALNGDGGDESFGGYGKYAVDNQVKYAKRFPNMSRKILDKAAMMRLGVFRNISIVKRLSDFSLMFNSNPKMRYKMLTMHFIGGHRHDIMNEGFRKACGYSYNPESLVDRYYNRNGLDPLQMKNYTDIKTFLPYDLLVKMDIATMANSLETRSPYLDHRLVEFAATIPSEMKVKGLEKKYILKKALKEILPRKILKRKKQGFSVPLERWFRKELKSTAYDLLLSRESMTSEYLNKERIKKLLDDHSRGIENNKTKIWNLLCLELWHRVYIRNDGKEPKKGFGDVM